MTCSSNSILPSETDECFNISEALMNLGGSFLSHHSGTSEVLPFVSSVVLAGMHSPLGNVVRNEHDVTPVQTSLESHLSGKHDQNEHALTGVEYGQTSLGIKAANGVVIATVPSAFVDEISVQNIQSLTPNIGVVCSGVGPGSRVLVQASIEKARKYHELKKEQIPVIELVKETATVMQGFTQAPGILMARYDEKGPHLYEVDPSGSRSSRKASAMGNNVTNTKTFLKRMFLEDMQLHVAVETAILTLRDGFEGQLSSQNIEIGVVGNDGVFKTLTPSEIDDYLRRMK